jgi:hypothetical protein
MREENMDAIDVCMLTKNSFSRSTGGIIFRKCLESIKKNVPVNNFIVIDKYSKDETKNAIREYFPNAIVISSNSLRGKAREIGIKHVQTEWFMFVDDDVVLCNEWFKKAKRYMKTHIGLIWGWDKVANLHARNRMKIMYYFRKMSEYDLMKRNFVRRGGLHDTLIRTCLVKDIKIPNKLHVYEDWYIKDYIERKRYKAIAPKDVYCYHYLNPEYTLESCALIAKLQKEYKLQSGYITLRNFILALPKALAILVISRDLKAAKDQWKYYAYLFIGRFLL